MRNHGHLVISDLEFITNAYKLSMPNVISSFKFWSRFVLAALEQSQSQNASFLGTDHHKTTVLP